MQLIGRRFDDATVLKIGYVYASLGTKNTFPTKSCALARGTFLSTFDQNELSLAGRIALDLLAEVQIGDPQRSIPAFL